MSSDFQERIGRWLGLWERCLRNELPRLVAEELQRQSSEGGTVSIIRESVFAVLQGAGMRTYAHEGLCERIRTAHHRFFTGIAACERKGISNEIGMGAFFPFRQYLTVGNGTAGINSVRAEHAMLHGLVFRVDDEFWDYHEPPWEEGCRCTTRSLTEGQVRRGSMEVVTLGHVRDVLGVMPGPEELQAWRRTEKGIRARLERDCAGIVGEAMAGHIDSPLFSRWRSTKDRKVGIAGVATVLWRELASVVSDPDGRAYCKTSLDVLAWEAFGLAAEKTRDAWIGRVQERR